MCVFFLQNLQNNISPPFDNLLQSIELSQVGSTTLRLVCVGCKGDWPYLRKDSWQTFGHEFASPKPVILLRPGDLGCDELIVSLSRGFDSYLFWCGLVHAQAFHLNCGFNCLEKCHLCDATNWEDMSMQAPWRHTIGPRRTNSPYWVDPGDIPLLQIPGMGQESILPDSCHCFHLGWGIDLAASGLMVLVRRQCFEGRSLEIRLQMAYRSFTRWCHENKKTTGVSWWSTKKLDMQSALCFAEPNILRSMV